MFLYDKINILEGSGIFEVDFAPSHGPASGANIGHFPKLSWRWCDGILWIEKRLKLSIRGVSCSNIEKSNANFNQSSFKLLELLWTNEDIEDHRSLLHSIWEVTQMFNLDI